jgi:hypothetical protein
VTAATRWPSASPSRPAALPRGPDGRRRFEALGACPTSVGLAAHPHLLRHALASAIAVNKEPASIAAQLRHADGGTLAQRVYIHQLPQTAPRLAGVIEGVFGPAVRDGRAVSAGRRAKGNPTLDPSRAAQRRAEGSPREILAAVQPESVHLWSR